MVLIADDLCHELRDNAVADSDLIDWQQRYEGILVVAYLDGKAVAGISGPWPGPVVQYALTWWDRPMPQRQMELFDSPEAARRRVEEWAWRLRTSGMIGGLPANDPVRPGELAVESQRSLSWLGRLRDALNKPINASARAASEDLRKQPLNDDDLRGIHFAAIDR